MNLASPLLSSSLMPLVIEIPTEAASSPVINSTNKSGLLLCLLPRVIVTLTCQSAGLGEVEVKHMRWQSQPFSVYADQISLRSLPSSTFSPTSSRSSRDVAAFLLLFIASRWSVKGRTKVQRRGI